MTFVRKLQKMLPGREGESVKKRWKPYFMNCPLDVSRVVYSHDSTNYLPCFNIGHQGVLVGTVQARVRTLVRASYEAIQSYAKLHVLYDLRSVLHCSPLKEEILRSNEKIRKFKKDSTNILWVTVPFLWSFMI